MEGIVEKYTKSALVYQDDIIETNRILGGKIRELEDKFDTLSGAGTCFCSCNCCRPNDTVNASGADDEKRRRIEQFCDRLHRAGGTA